MGEAPCGSGGSGASRPLHRRSARSAQSGFARPEHVCASPWRCCTARCSLILKEACLSVDVPLKCGPGSIELPRSSAPIITANQLLYVHFERPDLEIAQRYL